LNSGMANISNNDKLHKYFLKSPSFAPYFTSVYNETCEFFFLSFMHPRLLFLFFILAPLCAHPQRNERALTTNPAIDYYQQQISEGITKQLAKINWAHVDRKSGGGGVLYTIPVVVHVLHEYGPELISDDAIYNMISGANSLFLLTNPNAVNIIDKFKPVAASTQIALKLATKDPNGKPTKGIEHIYSYLSGEGASNYWDQVKISQWPPESYLNIWIIGTAPFYPGISYSPAQAAYFPYYDGLIMNYNPLQANTGAMLIAGYLNLPRPCSYNNSPPCTDADGIPDTPPCWEDFPFTCTTIFDTTCDTPNRQNVMFDNDSSCALMFTYGQGQYMQYILQIDIGNRDSLVTPFNYTQTGMDQPLPDLPPVVDFSIKNTTNKPTYFFCENESVRFINESWNDTITGVTWTFSNNAKIPSSTSMSVVTNEFYKPGWATVTLAATGNNSGTTTLSNPYALYIADTAPTNAYGYYQEFEPRAVGINKWPMFNYFNNNFKWQLSNVGYYDHACVSYAGYDSRSFPENVTGTPAGDYDDLFTPVFDLTGFGGDCYLNFMSSGATATADPRAMTDTLEIDYSTDLSNSWQVLKILKGNELDNKGTLSIPYTPLWMGDWVPQAIILPTGLKTRHTIFRFRYHPGANDTTGYSTGNNFYLDRFNLNSVPESIAETDQTEDGLSLQPNPASGSSYVIITDKAGVQASIITVTDITGHVVYETKSNSSGSSATIEIPGKAITAKGVYLVHIITRKWIETKKLVVY
jgi:type IX secretion system substrate protein